MDSWILLAWHLPGEIQNYKFVVSHPPPDDQDERGCSVGRYCHHLGLLTHVSKEMDLCDSLIDRACRQVHLGGSHPGKSSHLPHHPPGGVFTLSNEAVGTSDAPSHCTSRGESWSMSPGCIDHVGHGEGTEGASEP